MLMRKKSRIYLVLAIAFFSFSVAHAQESVSSASASLPENNLKPGISAASSPPVSVGLSAPATSSWAPSAEAAVPEAAPKAKRKKKKEETEPKKEEKAVESASAAVSENRQGQEEAMQAAMDDSVKAQVQILRAERQKEMPYLDRMYIRSTITPLKVQRKEDFLRAGSKDLRDLIIRAKSVHSQAKATYESINLYHRRVFQAVRKLFPEITTEINNRQGTLSQNAFTGADWSIQLRQPIFNGGVLWNTFLQERSNLEASKKQYDKVISDLIYDLSRAYFEYQRTLQTVEENRATVERMKRFADMSEQKFQEKFISEIERLNVQSLYSQMQFDLETAQQEFEIAKLDLQKYLDLSVDDEVTLKRTYDLNDLLQRIPEGDPSDPSAAGSLATVAKFLGDEKGPELPQIIDLSYANRPELKVEAAKLQASRLGERVKWGEFLPKVYLTYKFGELGEAYRYPDEVYTGGDPYGFIQDSPQLKKQWQLMLEMNWNVGGNKVSYTFDRDQQAPSISQYLGQGGDKLRKNNVSIGVLDGLDAYVNVKQAEVDKLNQVVELEKAEKQVLQDVKQAFYDYQKALIQVRSNAKRVKWRERLRDLAEHRLGRKEVEISEYMQSEVDLVRERGDLHKALKDYSSAKAALNHAIGIQDYWGIKGDYGAK